MSTKPPNLGSGDNQRPFRYSLVPISSRHPGQLKFRSDSVTYYNIIEFHNYHYACAGWPEGDRNGCSGDSGGPLVVPKNHNDNTAVIVGIASWVAPNGCDHRAGYPKSKIGVYTRVTKILNWIQSKMKHKTNHNGSKIKNYERP